MLRNLDYFITGSRAFGPYKESFESRKDGSDLDIAMDYLLAVSLRYELEQKGIGTYTKDLNVGEYSSLSFYFDLAFMTINIIALDPAELSDWANATNSMKEVDPIEDRKERIERFQQLVSLNEDFRQP